MILVARPPGMTMGQTMVLSNGTTNFAQRGVGFFTAPSGALTSCVDSQDMCIVCLRPPRHLATFWALRLSRCTVQNLRGSRYVTFDFRNSR